MDAPAASRFEMVVEAIAVACLCTADDHLFIGFLTIVIGTFAPGMAPLVFARVNCASRCTVDQSAKHSTPTEKHMSAPLRNPIKAIAFDAYGTLFDVFSIAVLADAQFPGHGKALAELWRDKQIDYTRLRSLCNRYADFWQCTRDALTFSCRKLGLDATAAQSEALLREYAELAVFPEVKGVLQSLRAMHMPLAILTNANPEMLATATGAAGIGELFDHLLSVDRVRKFKTAPEAYQLGPDAFGCPAGEILFVSSNGWDIAGATWFGYQSFWINRAGNPPEELGVRAHGEGRSLDELIPFLISR
jgi:2-haloacid dehalogenase